MGKSGERDFILYLGTSVMLDSSVLNPESSVLKTEVLTDQLVIQNNFAHYLSNLSVPVKEMQFCIGGKIFQ